MHDNAFEPSRLRSGSHSSSLIARGAARLRRLSGAMMREDVAGRRLAVRIHGAAALTLALAIFALDVLTPLQGAVAVLYTIVVLIASRGRDRLLMLAAGTAGLGLSLLGYVVSHWGEPLGSAAVRLAVSLTAIGITTLLSVRNFAAAEERRTADRRYRAIFEAAGFPIWEIDLSATYGAAGAALSADELFDRTAPHAMLRDINRAAVEMFGVADREALIGRTIFDYRTAASRTTLGNIVRALHDGRTSIREDTQFRTASGAVIDVILRVTLPADHDGWRRVLVMALDVTERNRTQARLDQSQAELAHVARVNLLGQLGASVAHEVNQPLSAIITYAKSGKRWLAKEAPDAAEVADCLDHIAANGGRAADVIARIRDMTRKVDPKRVGFALAPLIDETAALLRRDLQSHDVVIDLAVDPQLPSVMGDRVQIQQVLMNLMLNADQAMTATPAGTRRLRLSARHEDGAVVIEVRDTGPGIAGSPEALFESFFTTKPDGMGMGLSICRSIVERHGGRLTAANHEDGGAVFRFDLPVAEAGGEAR